MLNRIRKPHPLVGMKVEWVKGDENFHLRDLVSSLCEQYGNQGLTVLQVFKVNGRCSVALNKWGSAVVQVGTSNIRSFDWHLLTPIVE